MKTTTYITSAMLLGIILFSVQVYAQDTAEAKVKMVTELLEKNTSLNEKTKKLAIEKLLPYSQNKVFVDAVKQQNDKKVSFDKIKKIDAEWKDAEEELPIQKELTSNPCANEIKKIAKSVPEVVEAFAMDNQGANVGQNELTSDYWQGDEAKWKNSYNDGKGGIEVGKVEFDKSANAQIQQISLPIIDESGKVIGAITWGVKVQ